MTSHAAVAERRRWLAAASAASAPVSVRNIFYQATSAGLVPKTEQGYGVIQHDITLMRRNGSADIDWFIDTSRQCVGETSPDEDEPLGDLLAGWLRAAADNPGVTPWAETGVRPALAVESRSIAGMIAPAAAQYEIAVWPLGGYSSISFTRELSRAAPDRIGYLGDYDPDGVNIEQTLKNQLAEDHGWSEGADYRIERLAVTEAQIAVLGLPARPAKHSRGGAAAGVQIAVECEAIPAGGLRRIVESWAAGLQPAGWIGRWRERRDAARAAVVEWCHDKGVDI